jgi:hypothetical protein
MSEKFTPGEWKVNEKTMECGNLYRYGFEVVSPDVRKRVCYSETDEQKNVEQMQANAALIAAAPEMYRMLEQLHGALAAVPVLQVEIEKVLKKARGEQ